MNSLRPLSKSILLFAVLFYSCLAVAQQVNTINATLDANTHSIKVTQEITYTNTSDTTLNEIYLNDWNHSFSDKDTPLAQRFGEQFKRNFHLTKEKNRGNTAISSITSNGNALIWKRLRDQQDIIRVTLDKPLPAKETITYTLVYEIKLPSSQFTKYGFTENGNYQLRYWYITPAVYKNNKWHLYSNKDLDDLYAEPSNQTITFTYPSSYQITSDADTSTTSSANGFHTTTMQKDNTIEATIFLQKKSKFKTFETDKVNIITDFESKHLNEQKQAISVDKVVQFVAEHLGDFGQKNILLSKIDYKKNPVYGLNQLPSFLRPFDEEMLYELNILKPLLINNLKNTVYSDTRSEKWILDGIETYLLMLYIDLNYPNLGLAGNLSKVWGVRSYEFAKMKFNDQYPFLFMLMARQNIDQPLSKPKDSLIKFNNNIANKYKAGVGLKYLEKYFDNDVVAAVIKEFYADNLNKKSNRDDFENLLRERATKNIDWFFDEYVDTRNRIDFKIKKVRQFEDSIQITIKNKTNTNVPISLYGLKNDSIISKYWINDVTDKKTVTIPKDSIDKLVLNYDKVIPEFNQRDNWKSLKGFFFNNKPLKFTFFKDTENPHYNQVFFVPVAKYNLYDGFTPGLRLYNKTFLTKPLLYDIKPSYGLNSKSLVGSGFVSYRDNIVSDKALYFRRYSISGNYFHYADNLAYTRFSPSITFGFRDPDFRSNKREFLDFRYVIVKRDKSPLVDTEPDYSVFNARYSHSNAGIIKHFTWFTDFQIARRFSKLSFTLNYRQLFQNNRQFNFRFFAGKFIFNDTNSDFFSYALDRPTDYLFDYDYYGRSEDSGLFSQQLVIAEGGFKSKLENPFADNWIATTNVSYGIWKYFEAYGDIGYIKNRGTNARFVYDSGIRLNLVPDYFELYFPIYSNNGWEIAQPNYDQKIRFIVTLSPKTLTKLFTRKWF